jgi:hypothetical protein
MQAEGCNSGGLIDLNWTREGLRNEFIVNNRKDLRIYKRRLMPGRRNRQLTTALSVSCLMRVV